MTQFFSSEKKVQDSVEILEKEVKKLVNYFDCNSLRLNADKTEFIVFGSTESTDMSVTIDGEKIKAKTEVPYLGVTIDKKLTFQSEVKIFYEVWHKAWNESIYYGTAFLKISKKHWLTLLLCHLQYPAVLLCSLSQNLIKTLEKQLNWAGKSCVKSLIHLTILNWLITYYLFEC